MREHRPEIRFPFEVSPAEQRVLERELRVATGKVKGRLWRVTLTPRQASSLPVARLDEELGQAYLPAGDQTRRYYHLTAGSPPEPCTVEVEVALPQQGRAGGEMVDRLSISLGTHDPALPRYLPVQ